MKKTTTYQCEFCNEYFGSEAQCEEHEKTVHEHCKRARRVELAYAFEDGCWEQSNEKWWSDEGSDLSHPEADIGMSTYGALAWYTVCEPGKAHVKAAYAVLRKAAQEWLNDLKRQLEGME